MVKSPPQMTEEAPGFSRGSVTFGELLRAYRTRARLTQPALSEVSGMAPATIGELERGRSLHPTPETAWRLAEALALAGGELARFIALASPRGGRMRSHPPVETPFGALLIAHRGERSQLAMGRLVGVQSSWWGRLEADDRQPSRAMVERIAARLGLGAVERDRLLVAAGFAPAWTTLLYAEWPDAAIARLMARAGGAA